MDVQTLSARSTGTRAGDGREGRGDISALPSAADDVHAPGVYHSAICQNFLESAILDSSSLQIPCFNIYSERCNVNVNLIHFLRFSL